MTCIQCDTSDIPDEGIALAGSTPQNQGQGGQSQLGHIAPIGDGSAPLGGGQSGGGLLNFHFNQRQSGGYSQNQGGGYYGGGYSGGYGAGGYANPYHPYSYRKKRSIRKPFKPISVKLSQKSKNQTRIVQFVPILKGLFEHMSYEMERGNSSLFALGQDRRGRTYVETIDTLEVGVYNLLIRGDLRQTDNKNQTRTFKERYGGFNFKTRVAVQVL